MLRDKESRTVLGCSYRCVMCTVEGPILPADGRVKRCEKEAERKNG